MHKDQIDSNFEETVSILKWYPRYAKCSIEHQWSDVRFVFIFIVIHIKVYH